MTLRQLIAQEQAYLRELSSDQRRLLWSSLLYGLSAPMVVIFTNTYLWRQSSDPIVLGLFNAAFTIGLSIGFLLNGWLLRCARTQTLFFLGCALQGIVALALVLLGSQSAPLAIPLGVAIGIAAGIYYGNRNLLTSALTVGPGRFKYISLETAGGIATAISAPLAFGLFLALGERFGWYGAEGAYRAAALSALVIELSAGFVILRVAHPFKPLAQLFVRRPSRVWQCMRALDFFNGLEDGFESLVPLLMILLFLGREESVGLVVSGAAALSMIGIYFLGKRLKHRDHTWVVGAWTGVTFLGRLPFILVPSAIGVLIERATNGLTGSFRWASLGAIMYEAIDHEHAGRAVEARYAFLMDREFFLNVGRTAGLLLVAGAFVIAPRTTIQLGLVVIIIPQLAITFLTRAITRELPHTPHPVQDIISHEVL